TDGADVGLDLTGGWVDAGDNMKYTFTAVEAVTMLAFSSIEYRQGLSSSGQLQWMLNQLRWENDWLIKAHPSPNVFYAQVGVTASDHNLWIPIVSTQFLTDRSAKKVDPSCPGTDVAAGAAAAMAASSMVFR